MTFINQRHYSVPRMAHPTYLVNFIHMNFFTFSVIKADKYRDISQFECTVLIESLQHGVEWISTKYPDAHLTITITSLKDRVLAVRELGQWNFK